jgi:hypothetical protein
VLLIPEERKIKLDGKKKKEKKKEREEKIIYYG